MSLSMYRASVPVFQQFLSSHSAIIDKAAAYAEAKKIEPSALLNARLYPDMFPYTRQVQVACDLAKNASGRLAGAERPSFPDTEASFADLKARIDKTLAYIGGFTPEQIDGSEGKELVIPMGGTDTMTFTGVNYLLSFALPNFFFHVTTAYAILRHCGLELGKRDFMMPPGA